MSPHIATADRVDRDALLDFVRPRHKGTLVTLRKDGRPQMSPVSCGVDDQGRVVVSTYPERAKARNLRRDAGVDPIVLRRLERRLRPARRHGRGDRHARPWSLVDYYRCIARHGLDSTARHGEAGQSLIRSPSSSGAIATRLPPNRVDAG
jgi:PPOX class probable F420-dependent enzyme